eukprot:160772_1
MFLFWLICICITGVFSSETYCKPQDADLFCSFRTTTQTITQTDIDNDNAILSTQAWVIDSIIYLPPGKSYKPGLTHWNYQPAIYIIDGGKLIIDNNGYGSSNEVGIEGYIFLCGTAEFNIINSQFRAIQDFGFQYWLWATDTSRLVWENSVLGMGKEGITAGKWFCNIRDHSAINATNVTTVDGAWEFAVIGNAIGRVDKSNILSEMYVSLNATLMVKDTAHFDIFFAMCITDEQLILGNLPVACDVTATCFGAQHPVINYFELIPPQTSFTFVADNVKIWAFAVELYDGTNVLFQNIPKLSNFAIGVDVRSTIETDYILNMIPGDQAVMTGLEATRTVQFDNVVVLAYMLWVNQNANVKLVDGSSVGDDYATGVNSSIIGDNIVLQYGNIHVEDSCFIHHRNVTVYETTLVLQGGVLILENAEFATDGTAFVNNGYTFFVNSNMQTNGQPVSIENSGEIFYIDIMENNYKSIEITDENMNDNFSILGTIREINDISFNCKALIVDVLDDSIFKSNTVSTGIVDNNVVVIDSLGSLSEGTYRFVVRFNIDGNDIDVYTFDIIVVDLRVTGSVMPTAPSIAPTSIPTITTQGDESFVNKKLNVMFVALGTFILLLH